MFFKREKKVSSSPWIEEPTVAYNNFLQYAGPEVNKAVEHNRAVLSLLGTSSTPGIETDIKVVAHDEDFLPLNTVISHNLYCSKITIRNVKKANFMFLFAENIFSRCLDIKVDDPYVAQILHIAYRNIVPSEFSQSAQLAGPMGFHEYLIDGSGFNNDATIIFFANSSFDVTPIKIVLDNCEGSCSVRGIDKDGLARVFVNNCDINIGLVADSSLPLIK